MPNDVKKSGDHYEFTGFLHLSPEKGIRHTKTNSGSYANERMCKVKVRVPIKAFTAPEFTIDVAFKGGENTEQNYVEVSESVEEALDSLPVIVSVVPIPKDES